MSILLGVGRKQAAKALRRKSSWSGGHSPRPGHRASRYVAAATGWRVSQQPALVLVLIILVVMGGLVPECVIVGSVSMRVSVCGCLAQESYLGCVSRL